MGTPRRALGDVKNLVGSAPRTPVYTPKNVMNSAAKPRAGNGLYNLKEIDFNKNDSDVECTPKMRAKPKHIQENELCSCDHTQHRSQENYTLLDAKDDFESLESDDFKMNELLLYRKGIEDNLGSWRKFLMENDFI
ncbi:hypothetical protein M3Y97_00348500 [Aphelenchoides bicaudatus]|nr:hypothetical protein M3Y97_00348500 [Aphelenchoides bicaudatus]